MKERSISLILAAALLVMLSTVSISQYQIFNSTHPTFAEMIRDVMTYSLNKDWDSANKMMVRAEKTWNKGNAVIAIKYADQDFSVLYVVLKRMRGAVNSKDVHGVLREGEAAIYIYNNITSISPKP